MQREIRELDAKTLALYLGAKIKCKSGATRTLIGIGQTKYYEAPPQAQLKEGDDADPDFYWADLEDIKLHATKKDFKLKSLKNGIALIKNNFCICFQKDSISLDSSKAVMH